MSDSAGDIVCDIAIDIGRRWVPTEREGKDRSTDLLLKAIRSLPEEEQDEVLKGLFRSSLSHTDDPVFSGGDVTVTPGPPFDVVKQTTQPLLVRLPVDLHERLRGWATSHGFSMAAIARGLVERFLDEQDRSTPT